MLDEFPVILISEEAYKLSQDETMGSKSKFWFEHLTLGRCLYKYTHFNQKRLLSLRK